MRKRVKLWVMMMFIALAGFGLNAKTLTAQAAKKTINLYATKGPSNLYAAKSGKYIYFTGSGMNIMRYDTKSGKVSTLVKLKGSGACLVKKGKYLYYSCDGYVGDKYNSQKAGTFRCSISGKNVKKLCNASEFALKNNKIYFEKYNSKTYRSSIKSISLKGKNEKTEKNVKFKYVTNGTVSNSYGKLSCNEADYSKDGPYSFTLEFTNKKNGGTSTVFSGQAWDIRYLMVGDYVIYNYANLKGSHAYNNVYVQKIDESNKKLVHSGKVY